MVKLQVYIIGLRNIFLGINLITLKLLLNPKKLVSVITKLLFHYSTLSDKGRFKQKTPDKVINSEKNYNIKINMNNKEF